MCVYECVCDTNMGSVMLVCVLFSASEETLNELVENLKCVERYMQDMHIIDAHSQYDEEWPSYTFPMHP